MDDLLHNRKQNFGEIPLRASHIRQLGAAVVADLADGVDEVEIVTDLVDAGIVPNEVAALVFIRSALATIKPR